MKLDELIEQLCTAAGIIMEDASPIAIVRGGNRTDRIQHIANAGREYWRSQKLPLYSQRVRPERQISAQRGHVRLFLFNLKTDICSANANVMFGHLIGLRLRPLPRVQAGRGKRGPKVDVKPHQTPWNTVFRDECLTRTERKKRPPPLGAAFCSIRLKSLNGLRDPAVKTEPGR